MSTPTGAAAPTEGLDPAATEQLDQVRLEANRIRAAALAEAEKLRVSAQAQADALVADAQRRADVIEERGRQELSWRRRQIRLEQEQLARRQKSLAAQLASLSELAARAEDLPQDSDMSRPEVASSEESTGRVVEPT